ncbi:MAG: hypothetical protein ACFWT6_00620 [Virgibacillus proomii]
MNYPDHLFPSKLIEMKLYITKNSEIYIHELVHCYPLFCLLKILGWGLLQKMRYIIEVRSLPYIERSEKSNEATLIYILVFYDHFN